MKTLLRSVAAAFSMFSALPVPQVEWNETSMRWMLAAFPLVGLVTGGACWAWQLLCGALALPDILRGAGLCLLPVLVTGGVHLDGYADTCDALASHASPQRRQEILKDPRLGAFAAIRLCCYFLASLALWTALPRYDGPARGPDGRSPPSPWPGTPVLPTPLPRQQTGGGSARFWRLYRPFWFWRCVCGDRQGPLWRRRRWDGSSITAAWPGYPSADSPGIWQAGFCRPPNSGCWPPPAPRSTFNL